MSSGSSNYSLPCAWPHSTPGAVGNRDVRGIRLDDVFKTELCQVFMADKACAYGDMCRHAHGVSELRPRIHGPRYKTVMCVGIINYRFCSYGDKCEFAHNEEEQRFHQNRYRMSPDSAWVQSVSSDQVLFSDWPAAQDMSLPSYALANSSHISQFDNAQYVPAAVSGSRETQKPAILRLPSQQTDEFFISPTKPPQLDLHLSHQSSVPLTAQPTERVQPEHVPLPMCQSMTNLSGQSYGEAVADGGPDLLGTCGVLSNLGIDGLDEHPDRSVHHGRTISREIWNADWSDCYDAMPNSIYPAGMQSSKRRVL